MAKIFVGNTKNGVGIWQEEASQHMLAHMDVKMEDIVNTISRAVWNPPFGFVTVEFDDFIGVTDVVETNQYDTVRWAKRLGRDILSRIVIKSPEWTKKMTVGICIDDDGKATMFTAFYGDLAPKEIHDPRMRAEEMENAIKFWSNHAFAIGGEANA